MRKIKPKTHEDMMVGPSKHNAMPMHPTIRIQLDHLPEAKKWEVSEANSKKGEEYEIKLKVKMVGISQSRYQNDVELELREIGVGESEGSHHSEE